MHAHLLEDLRSLTCAFGTVGGNTHIESLALLYGGNEGAHRFLKWAILPGPVRVEDVNIIEAHAPQAIVERSEQVFARGTDAIRAGPHVIASLAGDDQLIAQGAHVP